MAKTTTLTLTCPCCAKSRLVDKGTPLRSMERAATPYWGAPGWPVRLARGEGVESPHGPRLGFRWACNYCIRSGRAIKADPAQQVFLDEAPYFAYFDSMFHCKECRSRAVFSAKEQQYWYEKLKFWVMSRPKQCAACRRKLRAAKQLQRKLQSELSNLDAADIFQLLRISSLYLEMGNEKKSALFLARSRKRANAVGQSEAWVRAAKEMGVMAWRSAGFSPGFTS